MSEPTGCVGPARRTGVPPRGECLDRERKTGPKPPASALAPHPLNDCSVRRNAVAHYDGVPVAYRSAYNHRTSGIPEPHRKMHGRTAEDSMPPESRRCHSAIWARARGSGHRSADALRWPSPLSPQRALRPPAVKGPLRRFAPLTTSPRSTGGRDRGYAALWVTAGLLRVVLLLQVKKDSAWRGSSRDRS